MPMNKQFVSNFILAAISDVAETIRATDAKVGVTFALYSLVALVLVEARENIYGLIQPYFTNEFRSANIIVILAMVLAVVFFSVSIYHLLSTMKPRDADSAIDRGGLDPKDQQMWLVGLKDEDEEKLDITLDDYYKKINTAKEDDIIKLEGLELLRLNFIKDKKIIHYEAGLKYLGYFLESVLLIGFVIFLNKLGII